MGNPQSLRPPNLLRPPCYLLPDDFPLVVGNYWPDPRPILSRFFSSTAYVFETLVYHGAPFSCASSSSSTRFPSSTKSQISLPFPMNKPRNSATPHYHLTSQSPTGADSANRSPPRLCSMSSPYQPFPKFIVGPRQSLFASSSLLACATSTIIFRNFL